MSRHSRIDKKLVVVGDRICGKTELLFAFTKNKVDDRFKRTVFENSSVLVKTKDGKRVNLVLWETAGQEDADSLRPLTYKGSDVVLLCYSVHNLSSFRNIKDKWIPELETFCPEVPYLLVGNKELPTNVVTPDQLPSPGPNSNMFFSTNPNPSLSPGAESRSHVPPLVTWEEGEIMADDIGAYSFSEFSAKTKENVKKILHEAVQASLKSPEEIVKRKRKCAIL